MERRSCRGLLPYRPDPPHALAPGPQSGKRHSERRVSTRQNAPRRHRARKQSNRLPSRCRQSHTGGRCPASVSRTGRYAADHGSRCEHRSTRASHRAFEVGLVKVLNESLAELVSAAFVPAWVAWLELVLNGRPGSSSFDGCNVAPRWVGTPK
jgi:hypothetical protein